MSDHRPATLMASPVVPQVYDSIEPDRNGSVTPSSSSSRHSSSHDHRQSVEAAIQTQGVLPSEYLTHGGKPHSQITSETQTDRQQERPVVVSRLRQPNVYRPKAEAASGRVSQSSISTSQSDGLQTDNASQSQPRNAGRRHVYNSTSSSDDRRRYPRRHAHSPDIPSDHYDPYIPPSLPRAYPLQHEPHQAPIQSTPRHSALTQTDEMKRVADAGVQASPHLPQPSRIPRLSSHWKKPGTRVGLGDSFDRDSGYVGSAVQPKEDQHLLDSSPITRSSVSVLPENGEQQIDVVNDRETVHPTVTHYQPIQHMPPIHDRPGSLSYMHSVLMVCWDVCV